MSLGRKNILLLLAAAAIFILPLLLLPNAEFSGADDQAVQAVGELKPEYRPWFEGFWAPPEAVEGLLFSIQAALGAGIVFYYLGYRHGLKKAKGKQS